MGSWSDVIPEIVLSPDQAQLYKEKIGIWPPSKWVLPFNEEDGIENDDGLSRAFRSDITKWQFEKNSNGEWIIPIWQDETFVEHILTPRPVLFSRIFNDESLTVRHLTNLVNAYIQTKKFCLKFCQINHFLS